MSTTELIDLAERCKNNDKHEYLKSIYDLYSNPKTTFNTSLHFLSKLPFQSVVTTNFDPLVKMVFPNISVYPLLPQENINTEETHAFYVHGFADKKKNAIDISYVFAESEFDLVYSTDMSSPDAGHCGRFLTDLLMRYSILFIGAGLKEPKFKDLFKRVAKYQDFFQRTGLLKSTNEIIRYAMIPKMEILDHDPSFSSNKVISLQKEDSSSNSMIGKYKFDEIHYPISTTSDPHENLNHILQDVAEKWSRYIKMDKIKYE